tara:strand:- start:62 stop:3121 length:3060 start_codon:yes stop_codon:yes gene_type:complete
MLIQKIQENIMKNSGKSISAIRITELLNYHNKNIVIKDFVNTNQPNMFSDVTEIEQIYVITMDDTDIRRKYMECVLSKFELDYKLVISKKIPKELQFKYNMSYESHLSIGELGCLLSHLWCLKDAIHNKYKRILVLEDDVIFIKDWISKLVSIINRKKNKIDFLMLGSIDFSFSETNRYFVNDIDGVYVPKSKSNILGAHAIMYSNDAIKHLFFEKMNSPSGFDSEWMNIFEHENFQYSSFICYPNLCCCEQSTTSVSHETSLFSDYEKKYLSKCFNLFSFNDYHFIYLLPLVQFKNTHLNVDSGGASNIKKLWNRILKHIGYNRSQINKIIKRIDFDFLSIEDICNISNSYINVSNNNTSDTEDESYGESEDETGSEDESSEEIQIQREVQKIPTSIPLKIIKNKEMFREICLNWLPFVKNTMLPSIKLGLEKEAVLVEYRVLPHIELLIRNMILKLGNDWSYTIICGCENIDFINEIIPSENIKIINSNHSNMNINEYSAFLSSTSFWDLIIGDKVLIYQEDSWLFEYDEFIMSQCLEYDFVGAPFSNIHDDTPNKVGNGGFSIRTKSIMKQVISHKSIYNLDYSEYTRVYMEANNLHVPPEDVYFSKTMQKYDIGKVAPYELASVFSTESVCNTESMGGHCFWLDDPFWKTRLVNSIIPITCLKKYLPKSNIESFFDINLPIQYNKNKIDIDIYFFKQAYPEYESFSNEELKEIIVQNCFSKLIYHPKQISNFLGNKYTDIYQDIDNKIWISNKKNAQILQVTNIVRSIHSMSYEDIQRSTIQFICKTSMKSDDLLIILFIGDELVGHRMVHNIIEYIKRENCSIVFCVKDELLNTFYPIIQKQKFPKMALYSSHEFGNDIVPTMLVYDSLLKDQLHYTNIIKLHTKSNSDICKDLTNFLLGSSLLKIIVKKKSECVCISHPSYYRSIDTDKYNNVLYKKHQEYIIPNSMFVEGSMFCIPKYQMDFVLNFIKEHYEYILTTNMYDNNRTNQDASYIHFIERLFGVGTIIPFDISID